MIHKIIFSFSFALFSFATLAQQQLSGHNWVMNIEQQGNLRNIVFDEPSHFDTIPFYGGENIGPAFYAVIEGESIKAQWESRGDREFVACISGVECQLSYISYRDNPSIRVVLTNRGVVPFQPDRAGVKLGIDTYMDSYPAWFGKYFPTFMRCEANHFFGYLQSPSQHTLGLVCDSPIASWSVDYNLGYMDPSPHWFMGHRIEALNLDLLNRLPLPDHNPQDLYELRAGESREWIISFVNVGDLGQFESMVARLVDAPVFDLGQTTCSEGEEVDVFLYTPETPLLFARFSDGHSEELVVEKLDENRYRSTIVGRSVGEVLLDAHSCGKSAQAIVTVHRPWQWVFERAREAALVYKQKATSHGESIYGFYSAYLAARYFPERRLDSLVDERFEYLFGLLHDTLEMRPKYYESRIQNTSTVIGILVDKYEAHGDICDLQRARDLADWMIDYSQREDGAYYNHGTVYTSVIYIAKSVLELVVLEKELAKSDSTWQSAYDRHYLSAKRAIDQLVSSQGNFQTEGQHTFEDGMISCSALQIGMFALLQENPLMMLHYKDEMIHILESHSCLTQLRVPDGRQRQGTMRYWEAQYDVMMLPNMFNSPHGWSGWRAYATYYAYLLTADVGWLEQTYNAMGAFANLIDPVSGDLRWAFVVDPHLEVEQCCAADSVVTADSLSFGNPHPRLYPTRRFIIGEQYVDMVSDWQGVNTQDNDVHELFKCLGECFLDNAFLVELPSGELRGYNCSVIQGNDGVLEVIAPESQIVNLHCNLRKATSLRFNGALYELGANTFDWVTPR